MTTDPEVLFDLVSSTTVPSFHDDDLMIITYRPRACAGWVIANAWHERNGIVTAVLRRAMPHNTDEEADAYYDL